MKKLSKKNKQIIIWIIALIVSLAFIVIVAINNTHKEKVSKPNVTPTESPTKTPTNTPTAVPTPEVKEPEELIENVITTGLVDFDSIEITEDEINKYLIGLLQINTIYKHQTSGKVTEDSIINIDCAGTIDGIPFDGSVLKNYMLNIKSDGFMPGFSKQCIGRKAGSTFNVTVTIPEDNVGTYTDESGNVNLIAGKEAIYSVKINYIAGDRYTMLNYNELDDDAAIDLSGGIYTTLASYKEALAEIIKEIEVSNLEATMWEKLVYNAKFVEKNREYIDKLLDTKKLTIEKYYKNLAENYSLEFNEFLKLSCGIENEEQYNKFLEEKANDDLKKELVVNYIIKDNNIEISEEKYRELGVALANLYGFDSLEDFEQEYTKEEVFNLIENSEVSNFLKKQNGLK